MKREADVKQKAESSEPDPIDIQVGERIKRRRKLLGKSQTDLAEVLGLSYQQVQKYEKGGNRVSASMLWRISQALDVEVDYFFADLLAGRPGNVALGKAAAIDPLNDPEVLRLLREFERLPTPDLKRKIIDIVRMMGNAYSESGWRSGAAAENAGSNRQASSMRKRV
ncbi:MAG: helix-turn-helix domain-containing protein [Alphaproteobacteria bacterium]